MVSGRIFRTVRMCDDRYCLVHNRDHQILELSNLVYSIYSAYVLVRTPSSGPMSNCT